ncbi:MAG: NAD(P)-dependent oxidoreductase [Deltaproteobacteria bacterium]|nr:NAD(P)-dependent oxidoreductase [Deltaproteobacteria bacterium]
MKAVGLVGAGTMGLVAGGKILESGRLLLVYDVSGEAKKKACEMGAVGAADPEHVARDSEIILLFLPGPWEVESCVSGPKGLLKAGHSGMIIVDMSTVDPDVTERMAELAFSKGVGYLDAPVLGRPSAIGNWALPVGGRKEDLDQARSILELLASKIFHIGESGSGNKVKLLNQMMFGAINAVTAEMTAVAEKIGIAPKILFETIKSSQAATVSNLFRELGGRIADESYDNPTFTVNLLIKDVHLAVEMAKKTGAPPVLGRTIELMNEIARAQGYGNCDTSIMWKSLRKIWESINPSDKTPHKDGI